MTREPEWDESSRQRVAGLEEYDASICPCGCGIPIGVAHDKTSAFMVDTFTCYAEKALEQVQAKDRHEAEKANKPDGWDAGTHYYVIHHELEED